jgi:ABC-type transport system involved in multi-copper enzyme maturation permease subunit
METTTPVAPVVRASPLRAWLYLIRLSWQRQARARQMVWIALGLLAFAAAFVAINTAAGRWDMRNWRRDGVTIGQWADQVQVLLYALPRTGGGGPVEHAALAGVQLFLDQSAFVVFAQGMVLTLFLGYLLPVWSLSFATEALGGEREGGSLVWLLSRPLPRPAIYLAKFVAVLPWSLTLNVGGFALLCLLAGPPGRLSLALFWPAVVWATLAFTALFHLIGAFFARPAVVAIVYTFFLEVVLNLMPGYMKRVSISFYARCMMYEAGSEHGIVPDNAFNFQAVGGGTAQAVLLAATLLLLGLGALLFGRVQYQAEG